VVEECARLRLSLCEGLGLKDVIGKWMVGI